ncbi:tyrosine-type recombinase/integrase [Paenibacillus radicis (ex Xue et al. 2023)]|uniref:Tyrosine-type recombinase/integrase n=1 Tax=Paenibacillus radicis (ex Xue et al. 2023) TaxID=2972489 RepID=A0ABT1YRG8_9BACL|nr:tyrosine-type recombinase/integrase [Paenibacillus radicis (ex Xue et al. 2023)]MCR8635761.1 tyrosine-type recombinase/integrase [Paenibacillus radicis (ex Xue et al. 2023)]
MKFVQPIRDQRKIEAIKQYLKERNERDYVLFMVGINTGFRIADILSLTVGGVKGTHIEVVEGKTGKVNTIKIRKKLRLALDHYIDGKPDHEYLFTGRSKKLSGAVGEPICTSTAYKLLSEVARKFGLKSIGAHSMRKSFGFHYYEKTKDIALLMDIFNHSKESITLLYIGKDQDKKDESLDEFEL